MSSCYLAERRSSKIHCLFSLTVERGLSKVRRRAGEPESACQTIAKSVEADTPSASPTMTFSEGCDRLGCTQRDTLLGGGLHERPVIEAAPGPPAWHCCRTARWCLSQASHPRLRRHIKHDAMYLLKCRYILGSRHSHPDLDSVNDPRY